MRNLTFALCNFFPLIVLIFPKKGSHLSARELWYCPLDKFRLAFESLVGGRGTR